MNKLTAHLTEALLDLVGSAAEAVNATGPTTATTKSHRLRRLRALRTAAEWQIEIETGQVVSRAALARREGLSRAAVTQKLRVLEAIISPSQQKGAVGGSASSSRRELAQGRPGNGGEPRSFRVARIDVLRRFEVDYVTSVLRNASNVSEAARQAKIDRKHFWRLMQRNGILVPGRDG